MTKTTILAAALVALTALGAPAFADTVTRHDLCITVSGVAEGLMLAHQRGTMSEAEALATMRRGDFPPAVRAWNEEMISRIYATDVTADPLHLRANVVLAKADAYNGCMVADW